MRDVAQHKRQIGYKMCFAMQHIHIVNQRRISTQGPNIRGALQCSTSKMLNEKRSPKQASNIRGMLQCSISTLSINVCSSTLVPNVRGVLQHSTSAVPNEEVVQDKRQI